MNKKSFFLTMLAVMICLLAVSLAASADFKDDFTNSDYASNGWHWYTMLGNPDGNYIYPERRRLSVHLPEVDTSVFILNENTAAEDSIVEATFENMYSMNSQYGVICRYHDYGWYELRVIVSGENAGSYIVYKYDEYLKGQGKYPYVVLHPGMDRYFSYDIKLGLNVKNTLKMICEGDEIRVFINGNEQFPLKNSKMRDSDFTDGESGVMFLNQRPGANAQIDLTSFSASFGEQ